MNRLMQIAALFAGLLVAGLVACTPAEFVIKTAPPMPKQFPNANAVTLLKHVKIRVSSDGKHFVETQHIQRMALNSLGTKAVSSLKVEYRRPFTKVDDLHARVVRDGKWFTRQSEFGREFREMPASVLRTQTTNGSARLIRLSGTGPGSVSEFRFTRCGDTWLLNRRYLQGTLPVRKAVVEISAPSSAGVRAQLFKGLNTLNASKVKYTKGADPNDSARTLHRWEATDLPAVEKEAGAPHPIARAARIVIAVDNFKYGDAKGSQKSWADIASFYAQATRYNEAPSDKVKKLTADVTKGASSKGQKIKAITTFVVKQVRLVPVGLGVGHWAQQSPDFTLKHRYGDVKAKVTLAIAMLQAAGIKAQPVLVRSRRFGPINKAFPANVFDGVVLYIPGADRKLYDLALKTSHLGFRSAYLSSVEGLLVQGNGGKYIALGVSYRGTKKRAWAFHLKRSKKLISGVLKLTLTGGMSARTLLAMEKGSFKDEKARMGKAKGFLRPIGKLLKQLKAGKAKVTSASIRKIRRSIVQWKVNFTAPLKEIPKKKLWVSMHHFTTGLPSSSQLKKRSLYPMKISDAGYVDSFVFRGWSAIEYPKSKAIDGRHVGYVLNCKSKEQFLSCERDLKIKSKTIPVAEHGAFCNDVKAARERDNSLIVLFAGSLDKDKDGTPDDKDRCPTVPGPKANKGCPDTDGDGIVDIDDKCPNLKGLPNTKDPSKHGCPKVVLVKVTEKEIKILQKIFFAFGRAKIRKKSFPILDQVAAVLQSRKKIRIRIEGHTDNVGSKKGNLRLSDRRAAAVRKYLIKKGIDEGRLESKGYGMEKPLVPNTTKENRGKNRRVQFSILKGNDAKDVKTTK